MRIDELLPAGGDSGSEGSSTPEEGDRSGDGDAASTVAVLRTIEAAAVEESPSDRLVTPLDASRRGGSGRRQETRSDDKRGRYSHAETPRPGKAPDVALDATIRQAASRGPSKEGDLAVNVTTEDIRSKVRKRRVGTSIIFCVDASGSMGASNRMEAAKGAVLDLLQDAYKRRDRVGVVSFRGNEAEVLLTPTSSVELAQLRLRSMETGGATPLASGIAKSLELLATEVRRDQEAVPWSCW
jgi:magnesium chelatase subunit D